MNENVKPYRLACLFARKCGVVALEEILKCDRYSVVALLVHSRLPRSEDSNRGIRSEYPRFLKISRDRGIPVSAIDSKTDAASLSLLSEIDDIDFLVSLSWRYLVPEEFLIKPRMAAINVHRGKLPEYAGAEPVRRALENNEQNVVLTVHEMAKKIDAGRILTEIEHPVNFDSRQSLYENVERVKTELLLLYPIAIFRSLDKFGRHE